MKIVDRIALILVIIGALNWGSVGLFSFDCVAFLFGGQTGAVSRIIYTLVGIAGLWCITLLFREDGTENPLRELQQRPSYSHRRCIPRAWSLSWLRWVPYRSPT